jgi:hypothetical protein
LARLTTEGVRGDVVVALDSSGTACGWTTRAALQAAPPKKLVTAVLDEDIPQLPPDIPVAAAAQLLRDRGQDYAFLMHGWPGPARPAAVIARQTLEHHLTEAVP